jgi:hypothetical protein
MAADSNRTGLSLSSAEGNAIPSFMGVVIIFVHCTFLVWVLWKLLRMVKWKEHWKWVTSARSGVLAFVSSTSANILGGRGTGSIVLPTRVQSVGSQAEGPGLHAVRDTSQDDVTLELGSAGVGGKALSGRDQRPGDPETKCSSCSPQP